MNTTPQIINTNIIITESVFSGKTQFLNRLQTGNFNRHHISTRNIMSKDISVMYETSSGFDDSINERFLNLTFHEVPDYLFKQHVDNINPRFVIVMATLDNDVDVMYQQFSSSYSTIYIVNKLDVQTGYNKRKHAGMVPYSVKSNYNYSAVIRAICSYYPKPE